MIGPVLRALAGSGERAKLSILIFHRVLPDKDSLFPEIPDAHAFRVAMQWIKRWFNVLPLEQAVEQLRDGKLPVAALAITFDDGYADNVTVAAPILTQLRLPATFFIASGFVDGGRMWNDTVIEALRDGSEFADLTAAGLGIVDLSTPLAKRAAVDRVLSALKHLHPAERGERVAAVEATAKTPLRRDLMMRAEDVRALAGLGFGIGAHTVNHPILQTLDDEDAGSEIGDNRDALQALTGQPVRLFAYPNGVPGRDYSARHVQMVKRLGFSAAVTTAWGVATANSDRWQLPRFTPWDRTPMKFGMRMIGNLRRTQPAVAA